MTSLTDDIIKAQLDKEQLAAATDFGSNTLVLAPPGSGKTRVLVNAAAHRIRHSKTLTGHTNARALCLTFGTDAAKEMKQRLRARPLSVPAHRIWVGNYHAVSALILRRYGHLINWPRNAGIAGNNLALIDEAIRDLGLKGLTARNVATALSNLKGGRETPERSSTIVSIRRRYDELLRQRNLRDFDDLIDHACLVLRQEARVRTIMHDAYPFVLVDELQDTNVAQLELLRLLIGPGTVTFGVADDDQMIYGWRDAHPENLDTFISLFNASAIPLVGNYRCPPRIVAAANKIITQNPGRKKDKMESRVTSHEGEIHIVSASATSEAKAVTDCITRSVRDGFGLGQIAVLAPHGFKFDEITAELDSAEISYTRPGSNLISKDPAVKVLELCLRHIGGSVLSPADLSGLSLDDDADSVLQHFVHCADTAVEGRPRGLINRLLKALELGTTAYPSRSVEPIKTLAAMARIATDELKPSNSGELADLMIRDWQRLERAVLESADAVKIMTSFAAKGTEHPVVIMPFLNEGLVPYKRRDEEIDWPAQRRLFYVGITRAEHRLVLVHNANMERSLFLKAVADEATEILVV